MGKAGKESVCNAGDTEDVGLIPQLGRSPGEGNGNQPQYSCLKNPWTEEPAGLQSKGWQKKSQQVNMSITVCIYFFTGVSITGFSITLF